jgi:hypothetical protein
MNEFKQQQNFSDKNLEHQQNSSQKRGHGQNHINGREYNRGQASYQNNWRSDEKRFTNFYKIHNETLAELNIHPYSMYDRQFPNFKQPDELGWYCSEKRLQNLNKKRELLELNNDIKSINEKMPGFKYLGLINNQNIKLKMFKSLKFVFFKVLPKDERSINFDLKIGYENYETSKTVHIDNLLKWILNNKEKILNNNKSGEVDCSSNKMSKQEKLIIFLFNIN